MLFWLVWLKMHAILYVIVSLIVLSFPFLMLAQAQGMRLYLYIYTEFVYDCWILLFNMRCLSQGLLSLFSSSRLEPIWIPGPGNQSITGCSDAVQYCTSAFASVWHLRLGWGGCFNQAGRSNKSLPLTAIDCTLGQISWSYHGLTS